MLARELLDYLAVSDADFKPDLTAKICALIQRFAPDRRWQIDSLLQVMVQAGAHVKEEVRAWCKQARMCNRRCVCVCALLWVWIKFHAYVHVHVRCASPSRAPATCGRQSGDCRMPASCVLGHAQQLRIRGPWQVQEVSLDGGWACR